MSILLEEEVLPFQEIAHNPKALLANVVRLLDSFDMLVNALEYPEYRMFWYERCPDNLPVSEALLPSLLQQNFGGITFSTFCNVENPSFFDVKCFDFDSDILYHFRQLSEDQIRRLQDKLLFAYACINVDGVKPERAQ